ncbi:hypothetical protein [Niabella ginsengisoli]|uniref:Carboxypeptidase regulatory-like domain-containing protein n=1 Tax=Niabella ginsengisoli TaxID=522298 RepID=A0ABS9SI94_9BACT|nr:hypothetical protein [Niabella ginsengisoli]MCH5598103.1 hypothetical protein [Niabella ginsengisoli]
MIDPKAALWKATLNDLNFTNNKLFISAGLKSEDQSPIANSRVDVAMKSNNKTVFRRKMVTDAYGNIYIDTLLKDPKATKNLRLEITNKKLQLQIPVPAQHQQINLQFLPEGGSFITGYKQRVGFKAVDIYGKGADVKGIIKDNTGKVIDSFRSVHNGMGYVWLQPVAGQTYTALLENGSTYPLPLVEPGGYLLQVDHNEKKIVLL